MKPVLFQNKISVRKSLLHGYGVFADVDIAAGELIEECHTVFTTGEKGLNNYYFLAGKDKGYVIAFGYGSIYNHSDQPNTEYIFDSAQALLIFRAEKWIRKGEEILVSYGEHWFSDRHLTQKPWPFWRKVQRFLSLKHSIVMRGLIVVAIVVMIGHWSSSLSS